jgi:hypothetical protein
LNLIANWSAKIDQSLLRYFILQLLDVIFIPSSSNEQTFSQEFLQKYVIDIIYLASSNEVLSSKNLKQAELVSLAHLVEHCIQGSNSLYHWSSSDFKILQKLHSLLVTQ